MNLSESGYPGFQDFQDDEIKYFCLNQDIHRFKDFQDILSSCVDSDRLS